MVKDNTTNAFNDMQSDTGSYMVKAGNAPRNDDMVSTGSYMVKGAGADSNDVFADMQSRAGGDFNRKGTVGMESSASYMVKVPSGFSNDDDVFGDTSSNGT